MGRFVHLRTRLTVLYAGLFGFAVLLTAIAVFVSVSANARRQVQDELTAGGAVFDQIWALKSDQLADGARVLARDFGFRAALASGDAPTVDSALQNLRSRLALDRAFFVGADARLTGAPELDAAAGEALWRALDGGADSGVLQLGGQTYQAVAEPVMAPDLIGWIVFAKSLNRAEMESLEALAAIPLSATVLTRTGEHGWRSPDNPQLAGDDLAQLAGAAKSGNGKPTQLHGRQGEDIALAKPLSVFGEGEQAVLVLRYPLKLAMAPYNALMVSLMLVGLLGLAVMIAGSWFLARSITRPVSALDEAVRRLRDGEDAKVEVSSHDEIGRLALSFNVMAAGIRERESRITALALTDQETDLPNRRALEAVLEKTPADGLYVVAVGVDRFPQVRAAVGYGLAAAMLRQLGLRVGQTWPDSLCARLSSERLIVMLKADSLESAVSMTGQLVEDLSHPVQMGEQTIDVGISAGLARVSEDHPASPIDRAGIALDQARGAHLPVAAFDAQAYGDPASKLSLMSEMLRAFEDGSIQMAYQPKHDLRAGAISGVEALLRWKHPTRGFVSPDEFVELAEETGHIEALTRWTLIKALEDQKTFRDAGHDLLMSVNLSGRMLGNPVFAREMIALIGAAGGRICLEITETAVINNPEEALGIIESLRDAGIAISIDDYGSGLSSLTYLKQIHADELKIDKAFILTLDQGSRDALLVKSTIDLAHSLGMKVVAEGVETAAGLALLGGMGCDIAQGYFICRPRSLKEVIDFLSPAETAPAQGDARTA